MKRSLLTASVTAAVIFAVVGTAAAQDNPLGAFGTAGGSNARAYVYNAPIGVPNAIKWKKDILTTYTSRRNARAQIVFDENGDLYFTGFTSQANSGVIKAKASDGSFLWASPLKDTANSQITPIVGTNAVYSARCSDANPTVYALNKTTGAVIWESAPLPKRVFLTMALYDGVLYGVTIRDASNFSYAFAVRASDGAVLHATQISTAGDIDNGDVTLIPNLFGTGEHGMFWTINNNTPADAMYGVQISTTTAIVKWTQTPVRTAVSRIAYNAAKNALYNFHWSDYGSTVEAYDPATGVKRWVARNVEFGNGFNGGFYPPHTLRPDGSGFVFAGGGGDISSITDPGDLAGGNLPTAQRDWLYDGNDLYGESQTLGSLVVQGDNWVLISGTTSNSAQSLPRIMYVQDARNGGRLATWTPTGDPAPYGTAYNFRSLTVGPDGTIYYMNAEDGSQGSLYAISSRPFVPPVIAEVTPDPDTLAVYTEYTKQLSTSGGDPAGKWTVSGAPGITISASGLITGWTPVAADIGQDFTITVQASNPGGSGSESWVVHVVNPLAGLQIKTRTTPAGSGSETSLASDGANLYLHNNDNGELFKSVDGSSWVTLAAAPGGAPESWDDGALAYYNGLLITRRDNGTEPVLMSYDIASDTWTQRSTKLFGNTGFAVVGTKIYGNAHAAMENQGGHLTVGDLTNLDTEFCKRAQIGSLPGNDSNWFSRVVQLAGLNGELYGIKNDWTTNPRGTGDRLWKINPAAMTLNTFYGGAYDNWDHVVSPGTDLGLLPFEPGYGSALVALPAGWAGVVGAQGGLFLIAGRSPSNHEGFGDVASDRFAIYDVATAKFIGGALPGTTGSGTSATFHNGRVYIKRGGDPEVPYNDELWVVGPFAPDPPKPDLDGDNDVDSDDLARLLLCMTGPTVPYTPIPGGCLSLPDYEGVIGADFDRDKDVDQGDFAIFQKCFSGSGTPYNPSCVN